MKKTMTIILTLIFILACFSVSAEDSSTTIKTGPPPLLNTYGTFNTDGQSLNQNADGTSRAAPSGYGYGYAVPQNMQAAPVQPGFAAPTPPAPPGIGGPLAGGPGALMPPGAPGAGAPGMTTPGVSGGYSCSTTYSIKITPEKIQEVLSTANRARKYLKSGKLWVLRGPAGELEIRGGIVYQGAVVSVIEFNPLNGSVLPAEYRPVVYQKNVSLETIKKQFALIVNNLKVLEAVWYREPQTCWIIPLVYQGEVIASLRIYYDGVHIIPDYEATNEMAYYGS